MKKLIIAMAVAAVVAGMAPGHAEVRTIKSFSFKYEALAPCGLLCPDPSKAEGCAAGPEADISAADRVVRVPRGANFLIFSIRPELDWDIVICRGGRSIRHSFNGAGIQEKIGLWVRAGQVYVLRAWNYTDVEPVPASVVFKRLA